jgi:endonuclease-8
VPEGDTIHAAAARLRALEGEVVQVEAVHPRAAALAIAPRLDGRRLERVEAVGKNLLLTFEGGLVLRSHLRLRGRWQVRDVGRPLTGRPWLVLRGARHEAILWNGPVLELGRVPRHWIGPDIMADPPAVEAILARLRATDQGRELGEALLDQRLVAGIGNRWRAEVLFLAGLSPWTALAEVDDGDLRRLLELASAAMRAGRARPAVYRRAGRPCPRCRSPVASGLQGDPGRAVYWCPQCQPGQGAPRASVGEMVKGSP